MSLFLHSRSANSPVERTGRANSRSHGWGVKLTPMIDDRIGEARPVMVSVVGIVGLLLLIACANIANCC